MRKNHSSLNSANRLWQRLREGSLKYRRAMGGSPLVWILAAAIVFSLITEGPAIQGDARQFLDKNGARTPLLQQHPAARSWYATPVGPRIEQFCHLMDSLKRDPLGRRRYDSIMMLRPGLLDSATTLLSHYKQSKHGNQ